MVIYSSHVVMSRNLSTSGKSSVFTVIPSTPRVVFTEKERSLLLRLVSANVKVIENKGNNKHWIKEKAKVWNYIREKFNSTSFVRPRSVDQLQQWWRNTKKRARKEKMKISKSGGSTSVLDSSQPDEITFSLDGLFELNVTEFDRDADPTIVEEGTNDVEYLPLKQEEESITLPVIAQIDDVSTTPVNINGKTSDQMPELETLRRNEKAPGATSEDAAEICKESVLRQTLLQQQIKNEAEKAKLEMREMELKILNQQQQIRVHQLQESFLEKLNGQFDLDGKSVSVNLFQSR